MHGGEAPYSDSAMFTVGFHSAPPPVPLERRVSRLLQSVEDGLLPSRNRIIEKSFLFLRRFRPVRERVTIGEKNDHVEQEHIARYEFAVPFCTGKTIADIACGTGYGSEILRRSAQAVQGFDREDLCGNRIVDLEKETWNERYDVIVSFETIEHLANPEFFLRNAQRTANCLIVSTPIGEFLGYNPHHKQVWTLPEFKALMEKYFACTYYFQTGTEILDRTVGPVRFVIAVGSPRLETVAQIP